MAIVADAIIDTLDWTQLPVDIALVLSIVIIVMEFCKLIKYMKNGGKK